MLPQPIGCIVEREGRAVKEMCGEAAIRVGMRGSGLLCVLCGRSFANFAIKGFYHKSAKERPQSAQRGRRHDSQRLALRRVPVRVMCSSHNTDEIVLASRIVPRSTMRTA